MTRKKKILIFGPAQALSALLLFWLISVLMRTALNRPVISPLSSVACFGSKL